MLPERATMQASTSGQVQGCTTAVKHRQQHTANVCCFRAIPKRQHSTQYNVTTHAKRSSNDGDKQSFNPKDVEELKNLMPDPQDSLFDDMGSGTLGDDDELFASLSNFGNAFESGQYADLFSEGGFGVGGDEAEVPASPSADFSVLTIEERQALQHADKMLDLYWEACASNMREEMTMNAIAAHHRVMNNSRNCYQTALELSSLIEQFELNPPEDEHPDFPVPSWVRAYAVLDEQTAAAQQRYEQRIVETEMLVQEHNKRAKIATMLTKPVMDVDAIATAAATPVEDIFSQDADKTTLESVAVTTQQTNDPLDAYLLDILPDIAAAQQQPNILTLPDQHSRDSEDEEEEEEGW